jgi:L,D-peptidoglycan transpeptidase YkuD (ErfK/YbiS/YcfS/YnhG family)
LQSRRVVASRIARRAASARCEKGSKPEREEVGKNIFHRIPSLHHIALQEMNCEWTLRLIPGVGPLLVLFGCAQVRPMSYRLAAPTTEVAASNQLILVLVPDWNATSGTIQLFERIQAGKWSPVLLSFPCVVGKNGLGWGIGLHGNGVRGDPRKREGDGRAPAGVFRLNACMGVSSPGRTGALHFPYRQITATTEGVDDSRSRYYNRVVDRNTVDQVDWSSAEQMLRPDRLYQWVVIVEHNWKPYPGFGSCIFLHFWAGERVSTSGCTAMALDQLTFLVHWLNAEKHPLLVQLPESTYRTVRQSWQLP